MVLDSDGRLGPGTVTGPLDMAGNHILRALEPLKTNDRGFRRTRLRRAQYNVCEHIDLFSRCCRLGQLHPGFHRDAGPRIRNVRASPTRVVRRTVMTPWCAGARPDRPMSSIAT